MTRTPVLLNLFTAMLLSSPAAASQLTADSAAAVPQNTHAQQAGQTADEQSQSKPDLALVQKIRQAIVKDKSLSTSAHNCTVITRDGHVRLKGEVKSDDEKARVEAIATKIAGTGNVTNELTVKPDSSLRSESRS